MFSDKIFVDAYLDFAALGWLSLFTLFQVIYQDESEQKASDKSPTFRIEFQRKFVQMPHQRVRR